MALGKSRLLYLLTFGVFVASIITLLFIFNPPGTTVKADTDANTLEITFTDIHVDTMMSDRFERVPVNMLKTRHVARNIIVGRSIQVCTSDYFNAVSEAVDGWNADLNNNNNAFRRSALCIGDSAATDIEYVKVESRHPDDNDFYCGENYHSACFMMPPRTLTAHRTFTGKLLVIVNERLRPTAHDNSHASTDPNHDRYKRSVRTIAHELGHVLGLGDYNCDDPPKFPSLMTCARESDAYPAQVKDLADYRAIYEPNRVSDRDSRPFAANVYVEGQPGTVEFNFDAQGVIVEERIELRRWDARAEQWQLLQPFSAEAGQTRWIARNQPFGPQKYRLFSTTQALIEGQCFVNDSDCDPATSDAFFSAGPRIGFPTNEIALDVADTTLPLPAAYILDLTVAGLGRVGQSPDRAAYRPAELVTLEAIANTDRYRVAHNDDGTNEVSEDAILSRFVGWTGDEDAKDCGSELTCELVMRAGKSVTATFAVIEHELTIDLSEAPGASVYPHRGTQTYPAGTLVRVEAGWDDSTHHFIRWEGCTWVLNQACIVYVNEQHDVSLFLGDGPALPPIVIGPGPPPEIDEGCADKVEPAPIDDLPPVSGTSIETMWLVSLPWGPDLPCFEYEYRRTKTLTFHPVVNWSCDGECWVPEVELNAVTTYSSWQSTGRRRMCDSALTRAGGVRVLRAGEYEFVSEGLRTWFTVPEGRTLDLSWRRDVNDDLVAVLSTTQGVEIELGVDHFTRNGENRSLSLPAAKDATLREIVDSLREPEIGRSSKLSTLGPCPLIEPTDDGSPEIQLDSETCGILHDGGAVTVSTPELSRSFALSRGREWLVISLAHADVPAATFLDVGSGGYVILTLADGTELSRHIPDGANDLPALFDAMRTVPPPEPSEEDGG